MSDEIEEARKCDHEGHLWCLDDIGGGGPYSWSDFAEEDDSPPFNVLWCGVCGAIVHRDGQVQMPAWLME